jgi:predicted ATP-grasp superfamily ATP-dependent carboligase
MEAQAKAALPVIENLARGGLRVAAGSHTKRNSGFYSRACRERWMYPSPRWRPDDFKQWLIERLRRRSIDTLFPVGHYGALAVCEIQDEVRRHTRLVMPALATFLKAYGKIPTMMTAIEAGVAIPDSWFPTDAPGGIEQIASSIERWPVLVKPSVGVGARGIVWCHSPAGLTAQYDRITSEYGECYVQDFVPPGGMQYKVDVIVNDRQELLAGVVYGKTRMYPPDGGSSVLNYAADRPDIIAAAHRMCVQLGWEGICDFDFVEDPRDGVVRLMEINPRFPESFHMGTSAGVDFPMILYRLAHGLPVEPVLDYPKNRFLRFLPADVLWFLRVSNRRRWSTWPGWFQFFDRRTAYQLCRARDPGPIMGYLLENVGAFLNPTMRRERLRLSSGKNFTSPSRLMVERENDSSDGVTRNTSGTG